MSQRSRGGRRIALPANPGKDDDSFWPWLAGFIDGEGSIGWTTAGKYPCPYISISQHERARDVLEEIIERCGGRIFKVKRPGTFEGSGAILNVGIRSQSEVRRVLGNTIPHLRLKRQRALDVLAMLDEWEREKQRFGRPWTEMETAYVKRHAYIKTHAEIAERLRRTEQSVQRRAWLLWQGTERSTRTCPVCGGVVTGNRLKIFCCATHGKRWEWLKASGSVTAEQEAIYAEAIKIRSIDMAAS